MENASKALIIIGAILISILIVTLGVGVFGKASSSQGKIDLSSQEISAHNSQFEAYEGRVKGSQVRTLLNTIAKNNEEYEDRKIKVTFSNATSSVDYTRVAGPTMLLAAEGTSEGLTEEEEPARIKEVLTSVKNTTTYKVQFTWDGPDGLIDTCDISVYGTTKTTDNS